MAQDTGTGRQQAGSTKAHTLLTSAGELDDTAARITGLGPAMRRTSICGLGQVALGPVLSVLSRSPACPAPVHGVYGTSAQQPEQP